MRRETGALFMYVSGNEIAGRREVQERNEHPLCGIQ